MSGNVEERTIGVVGSFARSRDGSGGEVVFDRRTLSYRSGQDRRLPLWVLDYQNE
ncbi:hypothetical protein RRSWK_06027 [Rhodopirellula sp. SWK7]|nr:hypothetical protein RRSWK_06027 [Rhodopirellula sp. SWK7]